MKAAARARPGGAPGDRVPRHEVKFVVSLDSAGRVMEGAAPHCVDDPHAGPGGGYHVASLYYDTADLRFFRDREESVGYRRKVRLRTYGEGPAFLEVKEKHKHKVDKLRVPVDAASAVALPFPALSSFTGGDDRTSREVAYLDSLFRLRPVVTVRYDRRILTGRGGDSLRVTLDHSLTAGASSLTGPDDGVPLLPPGLGILEVKFDRAVPGWLTRVLLSERLSRVRYSKYCEAVRSVYRGRPGVRNLVTAVAAAVFQTLFVAAVSAAAPVHGRLPPGEGTGIGSGVAVVRENDRGASLVFVSDRGPNADGPRIGKKKARRDSVVFGDPSYAPRLVFAEYERGAGVRPVRSVPLSVRGGRLSGLPPPGGPGEPVPLAPDATRLPFSDGGVDPEGVTATADGSLWVCEEYGPSLLRVAPGTGEVIERVGPGSGLPDVLRSRRANKGFEGVAAGERGTLLASLQGVLGRESGDRGFIRLVAYDPGARRSVSYAYPAGDPDGEEIRIGDLVWLGGRSYALVETRPDPAGGGRRRARVVEFTLPAAGAPDDPRRPRPVTLGRSFDLAGSGWAEKKTEGLAYLRKTDQFLVTSDDDFGFSLTASSDPTRLTLGDDGSLTAHGPARLGVTSDPGASVSYLIVPRAGG